VINPRRIIVMTDELADEKQTELVNWLKSLGAGWAHYFASAWLIASATARPTVEEIVAKLQELSPGLQCFVFELDQMPTHWQGFLYNTVIAGAKTWFREQWKAYVR
jgi:hypothetical protein